MLLRLKLFASYLYSKCEELTEIKKEKKKIIIALAANYGNLGDVAITLAQKQYLVSKFPDYEVFEFKITDTFRKMKSLKAIVTPKDIITIVGGGNMGDMYDDIEFARQFVIKSFPKNKIIIFPQTISFSNSFTGKFRLFWAKQIYNRHKDLQIFVREKFSYEKYRDIFRGRIHLIPDIVMSMRWEEVEGIERTGVILCFRHDKEDGIDSDYKTKLIESIQCSFTTKKKDTHIGVLKDLKQLYSELEKLIKEFQRASVVVTDRLHGMILSYVTQTPCVVFWGNNSKILGCWEWIANSNYIRLLDKDGEPDINEVITCIQELSGLKSNEKQMVDLKDYFSEIDKMLM